MCAVKSSPESNSLASKAAPRGRTLLPVVLAVLASAVSFTPTAVHADTPVKGFFTDEEEAAPPAAKVQVTVTAAPQAQVQAQAQAQAQAQVDVNAATNVAVDGDEYDNDTDPSALSDFREPLADYGSWSDDATYGTVWYPSTTVVGADFAPYQTSGHWELDQNNDWMWVSDYDWGYIPFHYGRWVWIGGRGWGWIPGRVYAPAWVSWRMTDYGYIGWAPMAPSYYWFGGSAVTVWSTPYSAYVFCPSTYVFQRNVHTYIVRDRDVIQRVGAYSRPYHPARPSVSGSGSSASGRPIHGARAYRPASPSLAEAKIPESSGPQKRSQPDARAIGFSRHSTVAQARTNAAAVRHLPATQAAPDARIARPNAGDVRPNIPTHAADGRPAVRVPNGQTHAATEASRPTASPTPRVVTNPSTTHSRPTTPSVSPSRPSVSPSRPSVSPSRPSVSPSRPSFSPRPSSSPSHHSPSFGGGGHSFGGGHHGGRR